MEEMTKALRDLQMQLSQMSDFCNDVMEKDIEDIDEETLLEIERKFLCCKKKMFNAANGVNREFLNLLKEVPVKT